MGQVTHPAFLRFNAIKMLDDFHRIYGCNDPGCEVRRARAEAQAQPEPARPPEPTPEEFARWSRELHGTIRKLRFQLFAKRIAKRALAIVGLGLLAGWAWPF